MALLKFGAIVTEGSGSLGGHTIQNSKGGIQIRNKPIPRGNPSAAQLSIRSLNLQLQAGWRQLTPAQRKIWNDWPVTHGIMNAKGDKHPLSGHSLWMKYNYYWLAAGGTFLPNPSYWGGPILGPELILNGSFNGSTNWFFFPGWEYQPFKAVFLDTQNNRLAQNISIANATHYQFEFDIYDSPGTGYIWFTNVLNAAIFPPPYNVYRNFVNGHYKLDVITVSSTTQLRVFASVVASSFSIDNISLKQIF